MKKLHAFICALSLFAALAIGLFGGRVLFEHQLRRIHSSQHPALMTKFWFNTPTSLTVYSRSADEQNKRAELVLRRDGVESIIPREENESWHYHFVPSKTNVVFVLTTRGSYSVGYEFARLIKVSLPYSSASLDSFTIETLIEMESLENEHGRSWVTAIKGSTPDGKMLMLSRAMPDVPTSDSKESWRVVLTTYDMDTLQFGDVVFETRFGLSSPTVHYW